MSTKNESPNVKAALAWIDGFNTTDFIAIGNLLSDNYIHEFFPKSLNLPSLSKKEWLGHAEFAVKLFRQWKVEIVELIDAGEKVVLHVRSDCISTTEAEYKNEYIFTLSFDNSGESGSPRISYCKEFVDSILAKEFFPAEMERQNRSKGVLDSDK